MTERKPHRQICSLCHEVSRVDFWVPDNIWQLGLHESQWNSIVCLQCFTRLADERDVEWNRVIRFYPASRVSHRSQLGVSDEDVALAILAYNDWQRDMLSSGRWHVEHNDSRAVCLRRVLEDFASRRTLSELGSKE